MKLMWHSKTPSNEWTGKRIRMRRAISVNSQADGTLSGSDRRRRAGRFLGLESPLAARALPRPLRRGFWRWRASCVDPRSKVATPPPIDGAVIFAANL
jgi:hypothetical protein